MVMKKPAFVMLLTVNQEIVNETYLPPFQRDITTLGAFTSEKMPLLVTSNELCPRKVHETNLILDQGQKVLSKMSFQTFWKEKKPYLLLIFATLQNHSVLFITLNPLRKTELQLLAYIFQKCYVKLSCLQSSIAACLKLISD